MLNFEKINLQNIKIKEELKEDPIEPQDFKQAVQLLKDAKVERPSNEQDILPDDKPKRDSQVIRDLSRIASTKIDENMSPAVSVRMGGYSRKHQVMQRNMSNQNMLGL